VSRRSLRHAAEYALFRAASAVLLPLPEVVALRAGAALGWFAGSVLRIRRSVVDENLEAKNVITAEINSREEILDCIKTFLGKGK